MGPFHFLYPYFLRSMATKDLMLCGKSALVDIAYESCFIALCIIVKIGSHLLSINGHEISLQYTRLSVYQKDSVA